MYLSNTTKRYLELPGIDDNTRYREREVQRLSKMASKFGPHNKDSEHWICNIGNKCLEQYRLSSFDLLQVMCF